MRLVPIALLLAASSSLRQDPADTPIDEPQVVVPDLRTEGLRKKAPALFDPSADPVKDIAAAAARAKREDRRVLILWGADWCSWSRSLHSLLTESKRILRAVAGEYEVVRIDVGKYDRNADLLASYGVDLARTRIPVVTVLDEDGTLLLSEDSGFLESRVGRQIGVDVNKVQDFLLRYRAPTRSADTLYATALAAAARVKKCLLLHFEAPQRPGCEALEEWLDAPEVRNVLEKDFVVQKIDARRTLGGFELLGRLRDPDSKGLPWMAVLDPEGRLVATSDAAGCENIEFPQTDEAIAHFGSMLRKGAVRLFDGDVQRLLDSLRAVRERNAEKAKPKPDDSDDASEDSEGGSGG
jgi:thioredoxin-related protein